MHAKKSTWIMGVDFARVHLWIMGVHLDHSALGNKIYTGDKRVL